jgi:hypothetical protein
MTENKERPQAEIEIEALQDVFGIATTGFEEFYKQTEEKAKGNSSTAASSGDYSTAASSGNYSKAASSGNSSKAASSGNSSKAASSGDSSKAASSGDYSTAASSGYYSKAASSGNYSTAASSGNSSKAASSGDYSTAASSGYYSKAASSGNYSACTAIGYRAAVKGGMGNLLMASEYIKKDGNLIPIGGKSDLVDGKKIKPNCWYVVEGGEWVEVDFTDGIFTRVISNKKDVKKVKTDDGRILFIVSDDKGNSAHGETIAKAREDLIYKAVAKFDGSIPKSAIGKEWIGIYRAITGACAIGVRMFVESTGKSLDDTYTAKEIVEIVKGQYGAEQFRNLVNKE